MDDSQVLYMDRWVSRTHFRTFVYNKDSKKLAKSYDEYSNLIGSGLWTAHPYKEPELEQFTADELLESKELTTEDCDLRTPSIIEMELHDEKVVDIKPKKGRPCLNQKKV
jgi:hypothetical protein